MITGGGSIGVTFFGGVNPMGGFDFTLTCVGGAVCGTGTGVSGDGCTTGTVVGFP
jgi:hypothetical protein